MVDGFPDFCPLCDLRVGLRLVASSRDLAIIDRPGYNVYLFLENLVVDLAAFVAYRFCHKFAVSGGPLAGHRLPQLLVLVMVPGTYVRNFASFTTLDVVTLFNRVEPGDETAVYDVDIRTAAVIVNTHCVKDANQMSIMCAIVTDNIGSTNVKNHRTEDVNPLYQLGQRFFLLGFVAAFSYSGGL